ncbi:unnamed protein product [Bursaphelenchus xylophilus]|uniref:(pine wood nematode) hypothetical protein n=1 Tax=Bursaphelenchus xylophilus TaxID=6326 RepID=A0A1I7SCN5_BURXY|nr:unnamed protein product [Bursaphelenchus xylophilus]CAG9093794.1 unnamed protein product [Bursaphelenchus xylophilus]
MNKNTNFSKIWLNYYFVDVPRTAGGDIVQVEIWNKTGITVDFLNTSRHRLLTMTARRRPPSLARNTGTASRYQQPLVSRVSKKKKGATEEANDDGTQMEPKTIDSGHRSHHSKARSIQGTNREGNEAIFNRALKEFCLNSIETGPKKLANEFVETRSAMPKNVPKTAFQAHGPKNRYKDVICLDETRVKLTWPDSGNDYIHANYVNMDGKMRYICTQGPTADTTVDFWRMVWQEKCKGILMLCEVMEMGKKKCEQYWPLKVGEEGEYGPIKVKTLKVLQTEEHLHTTHLEITAVGETRQVHHILWEKWPDRGVPKDYLGCLRLIKRINPIVPVVVHCSAGIGRTGTIVGLEMLQLKLQKGEVCTMAEVVAELRKYRHGSVQTDVQFLYMHRVIMELATNRKAITRAELQGFYEEYDKIVARTQ